MENNLSLIKALAVTLLKEIDTVEMSPEIFSEGKSFNLNEKVQEFEIKILKTALFRTGGNQRKAAHLLGVKVTTLNNKIKNYKIGISNGKAQSADISKDLKVQTLRQQ